MKRMLTVGEILKQQREKRQIPLDQVEKGIRVREKYLKAIESGQWNFFSSKIYIAGIIKNYAKFLGLDQNKVLAFFRREYEQQENLGFKRKISSQYLTPETKKFVILALVIVFIGFFAYFGYQLRAYLSPPKVSIISPKTDRFINESRLKIIGQTEKEAVVTIFDERVYQNKEGIFEYLLPLKSGKNTLIIEIIGANGKKTIFKKDYYKK